MPERDEVCANGRTNINRVLIEIRYPAISAGMRKKQFRRPLVAAAVASNVLVGPGVASTNSTASAKLTGSVMVWLAARGPFLRLSGRVQSRSPPPGRLRRAE